MAAPSRTVADTAAVNRRDFDGTDFGRSDVARSDIDRSDIDRSDIDPVPVAVGRDAGTAGRMGFMGQVSSIWLDIQAAVPRRASARRYFIRRSHNNRV